MKELAGSVQVRELARVLTREFGVPRTRHAVSVRGRLLGLSLWWDGYSQNQVAEIFGVWFKTVERWRLEGLLPAEPWEIGRGRFGQWLFNDSALAHFIDTCQWAYDVDAMPRGRWRTRAEVAHRAEPWLTIPQLVKLWGVVPTTIVHWVGQGRVPHRRRYAGPGRPKIVVRAADLPGLRAELREQALSNMRAAIKLRDERRRQKVAA